MQPFCALREPFLAKQLACAALADKVVENQVRVVPEILLAGLLLQVLPTLLTFAGPILAALS